MRGIVSRSGILTVLTVAAFLSSLCGTAMAQTCSDPSNCVTVMHTNDMHSKFLASPNADYTPDSTGDDITIGGIARIGTKMLDVRADMDLQGIPVLALDGGDFSMGTLFHLLGGEAEMGVMNYLGYDAVTLGNHEFDLLPTGTASIVSFRDQIRVLATNLEVLDPSDPWGAAIQALIDSGDIQRTAVQDLPNGIRVGYFGIIGDGAWEDVNKPDGEAAYPLGMTDRFTAASDAVATLRADPDLDIVICLSHSGVDEPGPPWTGEDVDLAAAVPGIDVIISGHTHTLIPTPEVVGKTVIVQAKSYTSRLGVLELEYDSVGEQWNILAYESAVMDDSILGDAGTEAKVQQYIDQLDAEVLGPLGYAFSDAIAETDFDLKGTFMLEHPLGNLVTDAILWSVNQILDPSDPALIAVESDGVIRNNILAGTTGVIQTSDAFEVVPLGVDPVSGQGGYPLVSFCLSGGELHSAAWVDALAGYLNDSDFWISWAGAGFQYVDYLPPGTMWLCGDPSDPDCSLRRRIPYNDGLYRVALNYYVASNIARVEDLSFGLIKIFPKDCDTGQPLASLADAIVYEAPGDPLMEWEGFFDYLSSFPDADDPPDGIPNMPVRYEGPEGRILRACVVATVSYGSPYDEKVSLLRDFRDKILMKTRMGREFVDFYYTHGSAVAGVLAHSEWLKALVRVLLLPLVGVAKVLLLLI